MRLSERLKSVGRVAWLICIKFVTNIGELLLTPLELHGERTCPFVQLFKKPQHLTEDVYFYCFEERHADGETRRYCAILQLRTHTYNMSGRRRSWTSENYFNRLKFSVRYMAEN